MHKFSIIYDGVDLEYPLTDKLGKLNVVYYTIKYYLAMKMPEELIGPLHEWTSVALLSQR